MGRGFLTLSLFFSWLLLGRKRGREARGEGRGCCAVDMAGGLVAGVRSS